METQFDEKFWADKDRIYDAMHRAIQRLPEVKPSKPGDVHEFTSTFQVARDSDRRLKKLRTETSKPHKEGLESGKKQDGDFDFGDGPFSDE